MGTEIGSFNGLTELSQKLAESEEVRQCLALNWFRFAYGRTESEETQSVVDEVDAALRDTDGDFKDMLLALTQTDAFLYLPVQRTE